MAFGLCYNETDLVMAMGQAQATVEKIPPQDRALFNACWSGGLSQWGVAPDAPAQYQEGDTVVKVIVVNATHQGKPVTKEQFALLLERMALANRPNADFLTAIAQDLRWSAVEPWPS